MKEYMNIDTQGRDRTFADRKAFVLSEQTAEMAAALAAATAPVAAAPIATDKIVDPNWQRARGRQAIRETAESSRKAAFLRVLGELTYHALPLDEAEKVPFRETVLDQTAELAQSLVEHWKLTDAGNELLETAIGVVEGVEDWSTAVTESVQSGELELMVQHVSSEIERRVVTAIVADRERSERIETRLAEVTATSSGDSELDALRARRTTKRASPSLMESLYVANSRLLNEDGSAVVSAEIMMVETVCQYTLIETLAAVGIMSLDAVDVAVLARRLSARAAK